MSEDDRAAKAARAKALLNKKRQLKKGADAPAEVASPAPSSPPSRAHTPAIRQQTPATEEHQRDLSNIFTRQDHDQQWLSPETPAPEPVPAPPAPVNGHPIEPIASKPTEEHGLRDEVRKLHEELLNREQALIAAQKQVKDLEIHIQDSLSQHGNALSRLETQLKTISAERDKALAAERESDTRLQEAEGAVAALRPQLQALRDAQDEKDQTLQNQQQTINLLVSEKASLSAELERLEQVETESQNLASQLESERQKSARIEQKNHDLQEQNVKGERRIEELESSVKDALERYHDTERQLELANRSVVELQGQVRKFRELEEQWQTDSEDRARRLEQSLQNVQDRADALELQLSKSRQAYGSLKSEKETISAELARLGDSNRDLAAKLQSAQQQVDASAEQIAALNQSNGDAIRERDELVSKLDKTRQDLEKSTNAISSLSSQYENSLLELKRSSKRVEELENLQKNLQAEGADLLRSLEEMRTKVVQLSGDKADLGERISGLEHTLKSRDATILQLESTLHEMEKEKEEHTRLATESATLLEKEKQALYQQEEADRYLQGLVDDLQKAVASLESDRAQQAQELKTRLQDIERLRAEAEKYRVDLESTRQMLDDRVQAQEEAEALLQHIQDEVESLRAEVAAKSEAIEHLRRTSTSIDGHPSLDDELLDSMRQRHTLELSAAQSRIRALETAVFEAEARSHSLQKQLSATEDRMSQLRLTTGSNISRPASRVLSPSQELRRTSLSSPRPTALSRAISAFDQDLSPETLHKRHISLGLLRARLDSEIKHSKLMAPASEHPASHQFLDESHVFFCSSCDGDLVVL